MFSSAQSSYPLSDTRHPPTLARSFDSSGGYPGQGAGTPWFSATGSAARAAPPDYPCLSRSGQQISHPSPVHGLALGCSPSSSSAPSTPRYGHSALAGPEVHRYQHLYQYGFPGDKGNAASVMSASLPSIASLPSLPPFAHSKLTALPAVDMEYDRLARACGQGPTSTFGSEYASSSRSRLGVGESYSRGSTNTVSDAPRVEAPTVHMPLDDPVLDVPLALSWGLRPRATSVRVPQRHSPPHLPSRPRSTSQPASIPVFSPSSPRGVLRSLRDVLDLEGMKLEDCLDVHEVLERWDTQRDRGLARSEAVHHKTFGSPVSTAVKCASMSTVLGGYQHHVPWVVYACVEELNRTGIYQPGLFRAVPNRTRLARLVEAFDQCAPPCAAPSDIDEICPRMAPTLSTTRASLRKESMPDICALLKTYLDLLPEPLLDANITAALHLLCVQPSIAREHEADNAGSAGEGGYFARARSAPPPASTRFASMTHDVPMTPSEHVNVQLSLEAPQILVAQHLLRLAPPSSLALLAYLLGFFTQLPLCPDNGIDFTDVARMFGRVLVGGRHIDVQVVRETVHWLLERWGRISDGLFEIAAGADDGHADSAPVSALKSAFSSPAHSPPPDSTETTPRLVQDEGNETGMARMQMPYDPGLYDHSLSPRPHSTSVSSDGSSATSASLETEEMYMPDLACAVAAAKDSMVAEDGLLAVREYEAPFDPFDRSTRIPAAYGLVDREYVSCPASPRRFARETYHDAAFEFLPSPPASVRSVEIEGSWMGYSGSTSRCSPSPLEPPPAPSSPYGHPDSDGESPGEALRPSDNTPRNSFHRFATSA